MLKHGDRWLMKPWDFYSESCDGQTQLNICTIKSCWKYLWRGSLINEEI